MQLIGDTTASLRDIAAIDWNEKFAALGTKNIAADIYFSDALFEKEKEVFRRSWLQVGRVEEVKKPGDYLLVELDFLNHASIIVSRGRDGALHAFHNACSHRGNRLVCQERGSANQFVCGYHGWTFGPDGAVSYIPDEESFAGLDRRSMDLTRVHVDTWEGFIFINLLAQPRSSLKAFLGPELAAAVHGYPFDEMSASSYWWSMDVQANWKLVRDGFIETYHVSCVHDKSLPNASWGPLNPFSHCVDFRLYDRHCSLGVAGNPDFAPSLMGTFSYLQPPCAPEFDLPAGMNPTRSEFWVQDIHMVFPNFVFDPSLGRFFGSYYSYSFWPLSKERTRIIHKLYFPQPKTAAQRAAQEYGKVLQREAVMEDFLLLEEQHKAVYSGARKEFPLQAQEVLIRHQIAVMEREIRSLEMGQR